MSTSSDRLVELTDPEGMRANRIHFKTADQARWAYRHRHSNGLAPVFRRIGRRIYIDALEYHRVVSALGA